MDDVESLTHTLWECKYHLVWIPKYRKKLMFCKLREHMGTLLKDLAMQKGCRILEGHLRPDHVHVLISIPPKYSVSQVVVSSKEKVRFTLPGISGTKAEFTSQHFGPRVLCFHRWQR